MIYRGNKNNIKIGVLLSIIERLKTFRSILIAFIVVSFTITVVSAGIDNINNSITFKQPKHKGSIKLEDLMSGIIMLESSSELAVNSLQARELIPLFSPLMDHLAEVQRFRYAVSSHLNSSQKAEILRKLEKNKRNHRGVKGLPELLSAYNRMRSLVDESKDVSYGAYYDQEWLERIHSTEDLAEMAADLVYGSKEDKETAALLMPYLALLIESYAQLDQQTRYIPPEISNILNAEQNDYILNNAEPLPPDACSIFLPDLMLLLELKEKQL